MSLRTVRTKLIDCLNRSERGDRGWFVITRVHIELSWLKGIAEYLEHCENQNIIKLEDKDYNQLAIIINTDKADPSIQIKRHHLLVMDKPLQLIRRVNGNRWGEIELTESGRELANTSDPAEVLEQCLEAMKFAVEPWSPPNRVREYSDFNVAVYGVTKEVLERCGGYIDRDEFDFFLSRVRKRSEVKWAVNTISEYRELTPKEKRSLRVEVRSRLPNRKIYQNWRDTGLHTFSLFSLGTSMIRKGHRLLLTSNWANAHVMPIIARERTVPELRMPELPEFEELLTPPVAPASNSGVDAESFVAKILRSQGWDVAFYTNRHGYGFDLWARRGNSAIVVEVKSSLKALGSVTLTRTEHEAAQKYHNNYFLALVENIGTDSPQMWMIQDPITNVKIEERVSASYHIVRAEWLGAAKKNA